jgi:hypothetical protein
MIFQMNGRENDREDIRDTIGVNIEVGKKEEEKNRTENEIKLSGENCYDLNKNFSAILLLLRNQSSLIVRLKASYCDKFCMT